MLFSAASQTNEKNILFIAFHFEGFSCYSQVNTNFVYAQRIDEAKSQEESFISFLKKLKKRE